MRRHASWRRARTGATFPGYTPPCTTPHTTPPIPAPLLLQLATPLSPLAALWAYVTLGATAIITEEVSPIVGGLAAHHGELGLVRVALSITLGTWAAEIGLYYLGRWRGKWVRERWPKIGRFLTRVLRIVRKRPWRSALAVRYAYGLRLTLPIACGAARVPIVTYVIGTGISSVTWASLFTVIGWAFSRTAFQVLHHVKRFEDVIGLGAVGLVGIVILVFIRRGAAEERRAAADLARRNTPSMEVPAIDPDVPPRRRQSDRTPPAAE